MPWLPASLPAQRRWRLAALILAVCLLLPTVTAGFFGDDIIQLAQLERWSVIESGPLDLYNFIPRAKGATARLIEQGTLPYFAAPDLKISFLRPLSSALMWLDHSLFGRWPLPYHLHTLLWFALTLAVGGAVLTRVLPPALATLAVVLFCLDESHAMAATWIAARNSSVACTLAFTALLAHMRWRGDGWRPGALLAPLASALALAAGEVALGALLYLLAWEIAGNRPGRWRALAPTLGLMAGYLLLHRALGFGVSGSGGYLDPFGQTLTFLAALPARALLLTGNLLVGATVDFLIMEPGLRGPLLVISAVATVGLCLWLPGALRRMTNEEAHTVRWLGLAALGALLLGTPALQGERVLMPASLGGAAVLAALLRDAWRLWSGQRRPLALLGLVLVAGTNLLLGAVGLAAKSALVSAIFVETRGLATRAEIEAPVPAQVVVLALEDVVALQIPALRAFEQQRPPEELRQILRGGPFPPGPDRIGYLGTTVLSVSSASHRLRRTAADQFELSTPEGTLLDGGWAATVRSPALALPAGTTVQGPRFTAQVLEDRAGKPTRVRFHFQRPLEDPSLVFLHMAQGRLRRFAPPPIGGEVTLARARPELKAGAAK